VRREQLLHILIGATIAILIIVPLGAYAFIKSGIYDVGASHPHTRLTEWITHETMIQSVKRHARSVEAPASFTPAQAAAGFCAYQTHCVACHGASAVARQRWVEGQEPAPPYLLDAARRFDRAELFWIVDHGIKMTGMPAWRGTMSEQEIWAVVAFLQAMPEMNSQDYVRLRAQRRCGESDPLPGGERAG
jgi:mono/diheme cytochrome c family protein